MLIEICHFHICFYRCWRDIQRRVIMPSRFLFIYIRSFSLTIYIFAADIIDADYFHIFRWYDDIDAFSFFITPCSLSFSALYAFLPRYYCFPLCLFCWVFAVTATILLLLPSSSIFFIFRQLLTIWLLIHVPRLRRWYAARHDAATYYHYIDIFLPPDRIWYYVIFTHDILFDFVIQIYYFQGIFLRRPFIHYFQNIVRYTLFRHCLHAFHIFISLFSFQLVIIIFSRSSCCYFHYIFFSRFSFRHIYWL